MKRFEPEINNVFYVVIVGLTHTAITTRAHGQYADLAKVAPYAIVDFGIPTPNGNTHTILAEVERAIRAKIAEQRRRGVVAVKAVAVAEQKSLFEACEG